MWYYFSFLLEPWFLPVTALLCAFYYLYATFDPLSHRNSQPQNVSHYQLPHDKKPSSAVSDDAMMFMYCSATELGRFLREKRITSINLVKKYVERLLHTNISINAAVNYRFSQAFDEAIVCDEIIAQLTSMYQDLQLEELGTSREFDLSQYEIEKYPMLLSLYKNATQVGSKQQPKASSTPITETDSNSNRTKVQHDFASNTNTITVLLNSKQETLYQFLTRHLPPFFGVPCTTKECFALKGMPHTSGLVSRRAALAQYTAPVVLNMQHAGLIIIATSNTSELCMWMESSNMVYGQTRNPYNLKRTPGGSSGGEGALLASLSTPISLGSDVGGSIRMPAFFNGVYGHKPTSSYISCLGQVPSSRGGIPDFFCQAGPMARYPADLWPFLQTMLQTHSTAPIYGPQREANSNATATTSQSQNGVKTILNLAPEQGIFGEHRTINLLPRPIINRVDVQSLNSEYATTCSGQTIVSPTSKHFHNPHGISGRYQQEQQQQTVFFSDYKKDKEDEEDEEAKKLKEREQSDKKPEDVAFLPYPHQNSRYYEFNSLKQYTQEDYPLLTSSHPSQVYNKAQDTTVPEINTVTPYQIDPTKVVIYSLKSFGSSTLPISSVDPVLISKQSEAAQFLANMGCKVYEIDVDAMISHSSPSKMQAFTGPKNKDGSTGIISLQKDPNFFIPQIGKAQLTGNTDPLPVPAAKIVQHTEIPGIDVCKQFPNAFEYWSAGMTLTFSAFRELLLQDCTVESMDYVKKNEELAKFKRDQQVQKEAILLEQKLQQFNKQQRDMMIYNVNNGATGKPAECALQDAAKPLSPKHSPLTQPLLSHPSVEKTCDPIAESSVDFTSHEVLSKYSTLTPEAVSSLPIHFIVIYYFFLSISTAFHFIRRVCIVFFLPLEGIPFFGEVEGGIETKRQFKLFEYLRQKRADLSNNQSTTPTLSDIHPPMPLSHVQGESMPLLQRVYFEVRVAVYILYHLCLSLCSRQLVPTGTQCLAEKNGEVCWHDLQPLPLTHQNASLITPSSSTESLYGLNSIVNSEKLSPTSSSASNTEAPDTFQLPKTAQSRDSSLPYPNHTKGTLINLPSLTDPQSHTNARHFQTTAYQAYLEAKSLYPHCNCTHVIQSARQAQVLNKQHNVTILQLISSFLPATPYTFPALLLGLIDRVGDLTPAATLASFSRCLRFSEQLNQLLAPSPTQPYGAVILAPPHPKQAPGHFIPCTKPFNFVYTGIFNATMTPVTSVPLGLHKNLPTGTQVVGARHCDATTIAVALLLHEQFGGWQPAKRLHSKYFINFK